MRASSQMASRVDDGAGTPAIVLRVDGREAGRFRRESVPRPLRSLQARSSTSRTPAVRLARRTSAACRSIRLCAAENAGRSPSCRRQRMSGSRRSVPRPEHGASTSTQSKVSENGSGCSSVRLHDAHVGCAAGGDGSPRAAPRGGRAHRRRPAALDSAHRRGSAVVFPPGDAHVSSTRGPRDGPASTDTSCDASSWTTNHPSAGRRRATDDLRPRSARRARTGRRRRGLLTLQPCRPVHRASVLSRLARKRQRRRQVVEPQPRSAASKPSRSYQRATSHRGCDSVTLR